MKYLLILVFIILTNMAQANTVWEYVDKKLEKKEFKRWSLSSWFYQREKMDLQDQWLSMNLGDGGIFFEFYADYSKSNFDADTADNENEETIGNVGEIAAYAGFFGLVSRYERYDTYYEQKEISLNFRLIGSSHQSTHFIVSYGAREFFGSETEDFVQNFYGADISLYLLPFLGFDGRYRVYINEKNEAETHELASTRTQWGAFIDIKFIRLFAYQFEENLDYKTLQTSTKTELQIKGTALGVRLYF